MPAFRHVYAGHTPLLSAWRCPCVGLTFQLPFQPARPLLLQWFTCPGLTSCAFWDVSRHWEGLHGPWGVMKPLGVVCPSGADAGDETKKWDILSRATYLWLGSWAGSGIYWLHRPDFQQSKTILDTELKANTCLKWVPLPVGESPILFLSPWPVGPPQEEVLDSLYLYVAFFVVGFLFLIFLFLFLFSSSSVAEEQWWYFSLGPGSTPVSCNCLSDISWEVAFV